MPSPIDTELRVHDSPVPTHTVLGCDGSIAIAPIDWTGWSSKTGRNVVPPSIDFHTPPDAAPTYAVVAPPSLMAAIAAMRPLIAADPMLRAPRPEMTPSSTTVRTGPRAIAPAGTAGAGA